MVQISQLENLLNKKVTEVNDSTLNDKSKTFLLSILTHSFSLLQISKEFSHISNNIELSKLNELRTKQRNLDREVRKDNFLGKIMNVIVKLHKGEICKDKMSEINIDNQDIRRFILIEVKKYSNDEVNKELFNSVVKLFVQTYVNYILSINSKQFINKVRNFRTTNNSIVLEIAETQKEDQHISEQLEVFSDKNSDNGRRKRHKGKNKKFLLNDKWN